MRGLGDQLFPRDKRDFPGKRWLKITLRTLHLMGLAGLGGAYLFDVDPTRWLPFLWLVLGSGLAMLLIEVWSHGIWLLQIRGLAILAKLLVLVLMPLLPQALDPTLLMLVIAISSVISHAPGRLRYYSPFYRRRITPETWQWKS